MNTLLSANWIKTCNDYGDVCPVFKKEFVTKKPVKNAILNITALGVYEARLNQNRVGEFILAPGWTSYNKRLQYQTYDITNMLEKENILNISVGKGWCVGRLSWENKSSFWSDEVAIIASINIEYQDGTKEDYITDQSWQTAKGPILFSEIYDGETYDAGIVPQNWKDSVLFEHSKDIIVPQDGEIVKEIEELAPICIITTPKGEKVIDFGQNLTGYIRFKISGNFGDIVELSHAEMLDKDGNFYTENLRSAKQKIKYICGSHEEIYNPHFTFQGFRYVRVENWPKEIDINDFSAIVVHSDLKRTGYFECSSPLLNKLYKNIIWGQKGNFLDVPTDCPQRDERLGWTGDAQVFVRAASYNFDVENFFTKWLRDLKAAQFENGGIPHVIPNVLGDGGNSAAWGDAAVICPWQIYLTYANKNLLAEQFECMQKWVEYMRFQGENEYLWNTGEHFGDWLGLDAPEGSYKGSTDEHLIATAFYAYSTSLLIKSGKILEKDMSEYENLYINIVSAFNNEFIKDGKLISNTQTAHVLALHFNLADDKQQIAQNLVKLIEENGNKLKTGFVGTPYLLHALSDNGYASLAYTLMLQEDYPSWLYSVKMGATTIWEHWDGIKPNGSMWSKDMNSFNHYAYGAIADWMYGVMAGINIDEKNPGFKHIIFKPITDSRLDFVRASIKTKYGVVASVWKREGEKIKYVFDVPKCTSATISLGGNKYNVKAGRHQYIF